MSVREIKYSLYLSGSSCNSYPSYDAVAIGETNGANIPFWGCLHRGTKRVLIKLARSPFGIIPIYISMLLPAGQ